MLESDSQSTQIMPQDSKTKPSSAPSPGLLERLFGTEDFSPEIQEGIRIAKQEMPNMAPVQPYGFFSRLVNPKMLAYVSGGKNIYLNPRTNEGQSPQDIADTLTHEQTHINQRAAEGYGPTMTLLRSMLSPPSQPYERRPEEMEAFQAEKDRRNRMGRPQSPVPSFSTGDFYVPHDVNLPTQGSVRRLTIGPSNR